MMEKTRCAWVTADPLYQKYHDEEWGRPLRDARLLFEFLILEGMQAGLSWLTILKKRENFQQAFDEFDAAKIARYDQAKVIALLSNAGIIRNRLKIQATISNAQAYLQMQSAGINFADYLWQFVNNQPVQNRWCSAAQIPTQTLISDKLSRDLKQRGFKFVGSTICYAFMQAVGMVDDHSQACYCCSEV